MNHKNVTLKSKTITFISEYNSESGYIYNIYINFDAWIKVTRQRALINFWILRWDHLAFVFERCSDLRCGEVNQVTSLLNVFKIHLFLNFKMLFISHYLDLTAWLL